MDKNQVEKNIQRVQRLKLSCSINDSGRIRHFHNGHEYVEIGGLKWATMNVGANGITDVGLYFQLVDTQGYTAEQIKNGEKYFDIDHFDSNVAVKYSPTDIVEANWGKGWGVPTNKEIEFFNSNVSTSWVNNNLYNGLLCTDKTDSSKVLFFPASGYGCRNKLESKNAMCVYWTNSINSYKEVYYMYANIEKILTINPVSCLFGFPIRPIVI